LKRFASCQPIFYPVFLPLLFQVFPEAESVVVAEPHAFALAFVVAGISPEVVFVVEPQASVDIAVAFVVLVPVSVVVVEVDSSGRPKCPVFPNGDHFANSSSSVEAFGEESVHSSIGARTNYGLCSIPSNLDLHQNKNLELCYNKPSPDYNNVSDTNDLPIDATTNHSRKRGLHQCQEQRRHTSQVSLPSLVVRQTESAEGGWALRLMPLH